MDQTGQSGPPPSPRSVNPDRGPLVSVGTLTANHPAQGKTDAERDQKGGQGTIPGCALQMGRASSDSLGGAAVNLLGLARHVAQSAFHPCTRASGDITGRLLEFTARALGRTFKVILFNHLMTPDCCF